MQKPKNQSWHEVDTPFTFDFDVCVGIKKTTLKLVLNKEVA